nr:hypothetical protein [Ardenticatena sp.]
MWPRPFWQNLYTHDDTEADLAAHRLVAIARAHGGQHVLDGHAGVAHRAVALARAGLYVQAAEQDEWRFETAARVIRASEVAVGLYRVGVARLTHVPGAPFDMVLLLDDALALVGRHAAARTLHNLHDVVRNGGLLVVGLRDWERHMRHRETFIARQTTRINGSRLFMFEAWEYTDERMAHCSHFYVSFGYNKWQVEVREMLYEALFRHEAEQLFAETGWSILEEITMETERWWVLRPTRRTPDQ